MMNNSIEVNVLCINGAYFARFNGKVASCTHSPELAVKTLGRKIFGEFQQLIITQIKPVSLSEKGQWSVSPNPEQACRVCGCTWSKACSPGCHWVAEDLCSQCGGNA